MKHLIRAAGLLVGIVVVVFILPRLIPTSAVEELQSYGFYSGRNNSTEWEQVSVQYAESVRCTTCHKDRYDTWTASIHKTVNCENCHGSGETHIVKGTPLLVDTSPQLCENCHAQVLARPADFPQVDPNVHGKQANCITCHNPHSPVIPVIAHKAEGYDDCLLCHKSGGLKPYPKEHEGRPVDSCLSCHGVQS